MQIEPLTELSKDNCPVNHHFCGGIYAREISMPSGVYVFGKKHKTEQIAQEYLKYLYSKEAQHIIAANHFRPTDKTVAKQYAQNFPSIKL